MREDEMLSTTGGPFAAAATSTTATGEARASTKPGRKLRDQMFRPQNWRIMSIGLKDWDYAFRSQRIGIRPCLR